MFDAGSIASIPGISGGIRSPSSDLLQSDSDTGGLTSNPYYEVNIGPRKNAGGLFSSSAGNNQLMMAVVISIAATLIINYMGIGK